jgi:YVTN family beta-propeller protein
VKTTLAVPADPVNVAVDPSEHAVWVASGRAGRVTRIDATSNKVATGVPVGRSPEGLAVGDGALWVTVHAQ